MNLKITTKNHAADQKIGFLTKSIPRAYGSATAMPPAWELTYLIRRRTSKNFKIEAPFYFIVSQCHSEGQIPQFKALGH